MDSVREAWTDERLDELNRRVGEGFRETHEEFRALGGRLDGIQRTMVQAVIAMTAATLTGFLGLAALIVTQG